MFKNITIDNLMPSKANIQYTDGKIDINSIAKDKFINDIPNKEFNSDILLNKIKKKEVKIEILWYVLIICVVRKLKKQMILV